VTEEESTYSSTTQLGALVGAPGVVETLRCPCKSTTNAARQAATDRIGASVLYPVQIGSSFNFNTPFY